MFGDFGLSLNVVTSFAIHHVSCDLSWTFLSGITLIYEFELIVDDLDFIEKEE